MVDYCSMNNTNINTADNAAININPIPPIKPSKSGPINIFGVLDIKRSDGE